MFLKLAPVFEIYVKANAGIQQHRDMVEFLFSLEVSPDQFFFFKDFFLYFCRTHVLEVRLQ